MSFSQSVKFRQGTRAPDPRHCKHQIFELFKFGRRESRKYFATTGVQLLMDELELPQERARLFEAATFCSLRMPLRSES